MRIRRLGKLFQKHNKQLYYHALSITRNRDMAEDAVHSALVAVSEAKNEPDDLKAYLFRVVRNKAIKQVQDQSRYYELSESIQCESSNIEQQPLLYSVLNQLEKLSQQQQQIILLKTTAGMTFQEISDQMELSINTIASSYRRGLAKIQENLDETT